MIYRRKRDFDAGFVGDADALTEEFYDADDAANSVDHHNYDTAWLTPDKAIPSNPAAPSPAGQNRALTVGHDNGVLLSRTLVWPAPTLLPQKQWSVTLPFDFTSVGDLRLYIYAYGWYSHHAGTLLSNDYVRFDLKIDVDGAAVAVGAFAIPADGNTANIGWSLTAEAFIGAGSHNIRTGAYERSDKDTNGSMYAGWSDPLGVAGRSQLFMIGYRP